MNKNQKTTVTITDKQQSFEVKNRDNTATIIVTSSGITLRVQ
jgi:hypothetical protein